MKSINVFVPGRLCLFGEHSDWAGMYRTVNAKIVKGAAIVTGIEQGIYANAEKSDRFIMCTSDESAEAEYWECEMNSARLIDVAQQGGYYSYVAGVASYINDNYNVGGVKITITKRDLPVKSGLSSSAAICVLVARAFNQLYHLKMNVKGEMQAAFRGEQRTPSRCGRLDQACAYGIKPVYMVFDGVEIESAEIKVGTVFHWVIANLMASKDTIKILADLNKAYPFASNDIEKNVQEALGIENQLIVEKARELIASGDAPSLGRLMTYAQEKFDEKVAPLCSELIAPVLHDILKDSEIKRLTYGAKGVGSQGDGSVQFLARDEKSAKLLQEYLLEKKGMPSFTLTLNPGQAVKKAVIPLAGFGTRVFPATKCIPKCLMPVCDADGVLKPALLIMIEQLVDAGIDEICLIIGEDEQRDFERFFAPISDEQWEKLPDSKRMIEEKIRRLRNCVTYVYQKERLGFGHAVWLTKNFANNEPVLLLLGDFLYRSNSGVNCCKQVIDAYKECGCSLVSINEVPLDKVIHYGIVHGIWDDNNETMMKVDKMVEKPTTDYANEYLGVNNRKSEQKYYATFGQYVLTPDVYNALEYQICIVGKPSEGNEFGLTAALDTVRENKGLFAFVPDGDSFDIGLPEAYRETMWRFSK